MRHDRRERSTAGQQADPQQATLGARGTLPHRQDRAPRRAAPAARPAFDKGLARARPRADAADFARALAADVYGAVEHPIFWDFAEFTAQPQTSFVSDIHCVT